MFSYACTLSGETKVQSSQKWTRIENCKQVTKWWICLWVKAFLV